jgi:peptide-N4-(N-acetyl-beta-glucosaminyl)asparagine amidase
MKVWTEVKINKKWIHVDPCEASIDEPLLYNDWGKNQTYIFAYTEKTVEDVTEKYTKNFTASLERRRNDGVNESYINEMLKKIEVELSLNF